jgi:hypothetical protein
MGDGLPPRGGSLGPLAQSCEGGRGDSTWGRRGSARRQAAYERGDACRRNDWGCGGGHAGGGNNVRRAPEEEETGIFHPEVGDRSSVAASFKWVRA